MVYPEIVHLPDIQRNLAQHFCMLRTTPTIEDCYRRYDAQGKGYLTKSELKWAVTALLGSAPSRLVLLSLFEIAPASYEIMQVEKDTFVRVMTRRVANIDVTEGIRRWFKAFDLDSSGFISLANFKQVCQAIAPHMPPSVVHQLFREADTNHDDKVSYGEFERLMLLSLQLQTLAPHP